MYAALGFPGQRSMLACSTYGALQDRHFARFRDEYSQFGKIVTNQTHGLCFRFSNEDYGVIALRNLDNPDKYRGTEAAIIAVDEPTELPEKISGEDTLPLLLYPNRSPVQLPFWGFMAGMNPDGVGHSWCKGAWITGDGRFGFDPERFHFIRATIHDNPRIMASGYLDTLEGLPPHIRKARLEGSWDAPEGARWPYLDESVHLFDEAEVWPWGLPGNYRKLVGVDYGLRAPYCALWFAIDYDGNVWCYREDYQSGLLAHEQPVRIIDRTSPEESFDAVRMDPAMWARDSSATTGTMEISVADLYMEALRGDARFPVPTRGYNGSRVHALSTLDKMLARGNGYPDLYISRKCKNFWKELTGAVWDNRGQLGSTREDIHPNSPDHAITASYYALHEYLNPPKHEPRPLWEINPHVDLQQRAQETYERELRTIECGNRSSRLRL